MGDILGSDWNELNKSFQDVMEMYHFKNVRCLKLLHSCDNVNEFLIFNYWYMKLWLQWCCITSGPESKRVIINCYIYIQDTLHRPPAEEIKLEEHCPYK